MAARLRACAPGEFALEGELNFDSVARLLPECTRVLAAAPEGAVVDLSGVTRSDSSGVALVVECLRGATARGRELHFRAIPAQMQAIIRVADLDELIPLD